MGKKILNVISVLELILVVVMYIVIAYHFDNDRTIIRMLSQITFESTLLRLLIYIVPGINLICGLFHIVFSTKGILIFSSVLEIVAGLLTQYFQGRNDLMNILGYVMIVFGVISILCVLFIRKNNKKKEPIKK